MLYSIWLSDATPGDRFSDRRERAGRPSLGAGRLALSLSASRENEDTRWRMFSRILEVTSIATLLLAVAWRPSAGHYLALDLMACAGAGLLALTLVFRRGLEVHLAPLGFASRGTARRP